jgi:hypothetical protein
VGLFERRDPPTKSTKNKLSDEDVFAVIANAKRVNVDYLKRLKPYIKNGVMGITMFGPDAKLAADNEKPVEPCTWYQLRPNGKEVRAKNQSKKPTGLFLHGRLPSPGDRVALVEGPFEQVRAIEVSEGRDYDVIIGLPTSSIQADFTSWFADFDVDLIPDRDAGGRAVLS